MEMIKSLITKYREQKKELLIKWRNSKSTSCTMDDQIRLGIIDQIIEDLETLFPEGLLHEPISGQQNYVPYDGPKDFF